MLSMGPRPGLKNMLFGFLVLFVAVSVYVSGWPIAQRMEEYISFLFVSELAHSDLTEHSAVFASWRGGATFSDAVQSVSGQLRSLFTGLRDADSDDEDADLHNSDSDHHAQEAGST